MIVLDASAILAPIPTSLEPARSQITSPGRCCVAPTWPKWLASSSTWEYRFAQCESCSAPPVSVSNHARRMTQFLRAPCARFPAERPFRSAIDAASRSEFVTTPPSSPQIEPGPILPFPSRYGSSTQGQERHPATAQGGQRSTAPDRTFDAGLGREGSVELGCLPRMIRRDRRLSSSVPTKHDGRGRMVNGCRQEATAPTE